MLSSYYYYDYELVNMVRWMNHLNMKSYVSKICTKPHVSKFINICINPVLIRIRGCNSRVFKL